MTRDLRIRIYLIFIIRVLRLSLATKVDIKDLALEDFNYNRNKSEAISALECVLNVS